MFTEYSQFLSSNATPSKRMGSYTRSKIILALFTITFSVAGFGDNYTKTNLSANLPAKAIHTDPKLVNAWGLARSPKGPWWVADNGTGLSTVYNQNGIKQSLTVTIPLPNGKSGTSAPTGTVFNTASAFKIKQGNITGASSFIFVTEDGTISGWNSTVNPTHAVIAVNRSGKAIYKGCTLSNVKNSLRLYATNFKTGKVEAFNANFKPISLGAKAFSIGDSNYAPFNIQSIGNNLVVTFAKKKPGATDETAGKGLGKVALFDVNGRKLRNLQNGSWMNAPWGVALAPASFGKFSRHLLVGNFGDGKINAFNLNTGHFVGTLLSASNKKPLLIDGLWALSFGGGNSNSGVLNGLYFTAGPNDEKNGLFGRVTAVP